MTTLSYWGGNFPEPVTDGNLSYWGGDFPEGALDPSFVPPVGPAGVAVFAFQMQTGAKVTMSWKTDVIKERSANENQRAALWDLPRWKYEGPVYLLGDATRSTRTTLAKFSAQGKVFQLGVTFEAATLVDDAAGNVVYVKDTTKLDWAVLGQRVAVVDNDDVAVVAVVQDVTSGSITLDVPPGDTGRAGGFIMPTVPVFLDPNQSFARYPNPDGVELWTVQCMRLSFGYEQAGTSAFAVLSGDTGGAFHDATVVSIFAGAAGNSATLTFVPDSGIDPGIVTAVGPAITFHYRPGHTTADMAIAALRPWFQFIGAVAPGTLAAPLDAFGPVALAGGVDQIYGYMGRGATVTMFDGRPVWDRGITIKTGSTGNDSLQSMTELVDIGATLADVGPAETPDWGRQLSIDKADPDEWQWLKAFANTVQGRRLSFWLPTQAEDMIPVSLAPGALVIESTAADFASWFPRLRDHLQVWMPDGSFKYAVVASYVDNLDGTLTLTLSSCSDPAYAGGGGGATLTADELYMVSWLEKCRLESDGIEAPWSGAMFSISVNARVVQQNT